MSEVLMTLGPIRFSVEAGAFQRLRRRLEIRTARQDRAGAQTARQVLGEDETLDIEGAVYPAHKGGLHRLEDMRALARTHEPQLLTDGMGNVWGRFIVESVEEDADHFLPNGAPLRQGFRLGLAAWGGTEAAG